MSYVIPTGDTRMCPGCCQRLVVLFLLQFNNVIINSGSCSSSGVIPIHLQYNHYPRQHGVDCLVVRLLFFRIRISFEVKTMRWRIIWKFVTFVRGIAKFSNFSRLPSTESTSFEDRDDHHWWWKAGWLVVAAECDI